MKINFFSFLANHTKICTDENFLLYGTPLPEPVLSYSTRTSSLISLHLASISTATMPIAVVTASIMVYCAVPACTCFLSEFVTWPMQQLLLLEGSLLWRKCAFCTGQRWLIVVCRVCPEHVSHLHHRHLPPPPQLP